MMYNMELTKTLKNYFILLLLTSTLLLSMDVHAKPIAKGTASLPAPKRTASLPAPKKTASLPAPKGSTPLPVPANINPLVFDCSYYLGRYQDLAAAFGSDCGAARNHWVSNGINEGRSASPVFDVKLYLRQYKDLQDAFGGNYGAALNHWIQHGVNEGRVASYVFQCSYYLNRYYDLKKVFGPSPSGCAAATKHWLDGFSTEGRVASPVFDVQFYIDFHPDDLKKIYPTNFKGALVHFIKDGLPAEGRRASHNFAVREYKALHGDISQYSFEDAASHYLSNGVIEGRKGSSKSFATKFGILYGLWHCAATKPFSCEHYLSKNPDVNEAYIKANADLLQARNNNLWTPTHQSKLCNLVEEHWVSWGISEGRVASSQKAQVKKMDSTNPDPYGTFHWWGLPQATGTKPEEYCLATNESLLIQHANQLKDAGVDFVVLDASNHPSIDNSSDRPWLMIMGPFKKMLEVWSKIPGAPKIVPWVPVNLAHMEMSHWMLTELNNYRNLLFYPELPGSSGPLLIVTDNKDHQAQVSDGTEKRWEQWYTVRKMWAYPNSSARLPEWRFLSECLDNADFKASRANRSCQQTVSGPRNSALVEEVTIASAYQKHLMSDGATNPTSESIPKFEGRTFERQFETLHHYNTAPIAIITQWNEWIAQRHCLASDREKTTQVRSECEALQRSGANKGETANRFVDQFSSEYSRDIEPSINGSLLYVKMSSCIKNFKRGKPCSAP